jgi:hypothetical protein
VKELVSGALLAPGVKSLQLKAGATAVIYLGDN